MSEFAQELDKRCMRRHRQKVLFDFLANRSNDDNACLIFSFLKDGEGI